MCWSLPYILFDWYRNTFYGMPGLSMACVVCDPVRMVCDVTRMQFTDTGCWCIPQHASHHLERTTLPMTDHDAPGYRYLFISPWTCPLLQMSTLKEERQTRLWYMHRQPVTEWPWRELMRSGWTRFAPTPRSSPVSTRVHHHRVTNVAAAMRRPWHD